MFSRCQKGYEKIYFKKVSDKKYLYTLSREEHRTTFTQSTMSGLTLSSSPFHIVDTQAKVDQRNLSPHVKMFNVLKRLSFYSY